MSKKIYFGDDVLKRLQAGFDETANAVKVTLGPSGRTVAMEKSFGSPTITKDGVSVAREIKFDDVRSLGCEIAKNASILTAEKAGDGTTSSIVLTQSIFTAARKAVAAGFHPIFMQRGMQEGLHNALAFLESYSEDVKTSDEIAKVATLASNGDDALGQLIAEAMEMVGKDGVISVLEGRGLHTELEFSEGMSLDRGFETPDYIVDKTETSVNFDQPLVLLVDKTISNPHDILPALELSRQASRPLLIVSHGLEGDARNAVVMNTVQGMLKVCSVKAPRIGEKRSQILENLAILTGGNVLSDVTGVNLKDVAADQVVGGADNIKVTSETTTIFEGHGQDDEIEDRIKMMRGRLAQAHSEHDKEFYQQQASHMSGGIAVIRVGAASELEMKEYKARVEDALSATQSAVQSGIVPGGGTTLLAIAAHLDDLMKNYPDETGCEGEEERYGYSLLAKSLREPFMHIMRNAGRDPSECYFLFKQASEKTPALVMDARTGEIKDALEAGIIDPSRVIEQVLINSVSVAGTAITTACMITSSKTADCFDDDTKHV